MDEHYAYCCVCDVRYFYRPELHSNGKPCDCICECKEDDTFSELHCEVEHTSCSVCNQSFEIHCSPWDYLRGKHEVVCNSSVCATSFGELTKHQCYICDKPIGYQFLCDECLLSGSAWLLLRRTLWLTTVSLATT